MTPGKNGRGISKRYQMPIMSGVLCKRRVILTLSFDDTYVVGSKQSDIKKKNNL